MVTTVVDTPSAGIELEAGVTAKVMEGSTSTLRLLISVPMVGVLVPTNCLQQLIDMGVEAKQKWCCIQFRIDHPHKMHYCEW